MKKGNDFIQFESRWEVDEVICILQEWQKSHKSDSKADTVKDLIRKLEVMYMEW